MERSSRKNRGDRERSRSPSSKDRPRESDRDRDRDREREHKHRHHRDERRQADEIDDSRHRDGGERHHRDERRHADEIDDSRNRDGGERHHRDERRHADEIDDSRHRDDGERHHRSRRARDSPEDDTEYGRERSRSEDRARNSVDRGRDVREKSMEKVSSRKRKEYGGGAEVGLDKEEKKRVRVSDGGKEEKRERRRFGDRADGNARTENGVSEDKGERQHRERVRSEEQRDGAERKSDRKFKDKSKEETVSDAEEHRARDSKNSVEEVEINGLEEGQVSDKRREMMFKDKVKEEDLRNERETNFSFSVDRPQKTPSNRQSSGDGFTAAVNTTSSGAKFVSLELPNNASEVVSNSLASANFSRPTKVSSLTATNENGVNITRSDEVPGKSSTDGPTASVTGKSGNLSLDALAKAKKALQMQKELAEKLKKIPTLGKPSISSADNPLERKMEGSKLSSVTPTTVASTSSAQATSAPRIAASASSTNSSSAGTMPPLSGLTVEAVKRAQEVAARMGFRQDPQFAPLINMFPGPATDVNIIQKPSKAPVLRLDAQGREIDEHGTVINMTRPSNLSTLKVNINKQKKEAFQILRPELDADLESNPYFDESMGINKTKLLRPKRLSFQFVEEGKWSRQAEITRFKSQFGEARAKELKTKEAQLAKAKAEPDINPNLIEVSERVVIKEKQKDPIPETEWWDMPVLLSSTYLNDGIDKLNMEKITMYVEHPLPILPPAEPAPPPPQPLKLTKKENKKLRTQRRLAKERDRQDMIRQGLIEPPKSKVKMSNLMKVLGSEATQDPTRLEMEIRSAAAEREQAHVDRNIARKLTPAERREKKERKLFEDSNTLETIVTVYKVYHLSHPKTRFQVDVNAQENKMTGCAVISEGISVIVVEGGRKSNKRYKNLMMKRIDWIAAMENEEEADGSDSPVNKCSLVWQGSVARPSFSKFLIHQCRTEAAARKVFADAGVPHYWDLAVNYSDELV